MNLIISLFILGSFQSFANDRSERKATDKQVTMGIQMNVQEETSKSWIHQFEPLPLGEEMDHLEKMKDQRLNQFVSK